MMLTWELDKAKRSQAWSCRLERNVQTCRVMIRSRAAPHKTDFSGKEPPRKGRKLLDAEADSSNPFSPLGRSASLGRLLSARDRCPDLHKRPWANHRFVLPILLQMQAGTPASDSSHAGHEQAEPSVAALLGRLAPWSVKHS